MSLMNTDAKFSNKILASPVPQFVKKKIHTTTKYPGYVRLLQHSKSQLIITSIGKRRKITCIYHKQEKNMTKIQYLFLQVG